MLSSGKAASTIGVAAVTLRRWEKKGLITPLRTPGNHRRYPLDQIEKLLADRYGDDDPKEEDKKGAQMDGAKWWNMTPPKKKICI